MWLVAGSPGTIANRPPPQRTLGALLLIEPQPRQLHPRPMTLEALVREDRPDVPIESDGGREWLVRPRRRLPALAAPIVRLASDADTSSPDAHIHAETHAVRIVPEA